jgi:hypothetical protein
MDLGLFGKYTPTGETACTLGIQRVTLSEQPRPFDPRGYVQIAGEHCDWRYLERYLGLRQFGCVSFAVEPGSYSIRLPTDFAHSDFIRAALTLHKGDGTRSMGMGVMPNEFHRDASGYNEAVIWYSREAVPSAYSNTILRWRWETN